MLVVLIAVSGDWLINLQERRHEAERLLKSKWNIPTLQGAVTCSTYLKCWILSKSNHKYLLLAAT